MTTGREARIRAPEIAGGDWLNTLAPLPLRDLRCRFVLLDFWSSCCGNCLHVLDELRPLEREHADLLTVIGIHSAKFAHERHTTAVADAIARNGIGHPVRNDPDLVLWQQYAVKAWPTLVLIDPEGYIVARAAGEGQVSGLQAVLEDLIVEHDARGTLHRSTLDPAPTRADDHALRFPAKAIVVPAARIGREHDSLLVVDTGHHCLSEFELAEGRPAITVLRTIGGPDRGAPFVEANGLTLLPPGIVDYDVLVADTAAHALHGVRLADGAITRTVDLAAAMPGLHTITGPVPAVPSPWDVAWWPALQRVVVAAAGVHLLLAFDPVTGDVEILAGTTVEGLRDGPALDAWLAQPSGLAVDGDQLWFVDAESSALRVLDTSAHVRTVVGAGLFDFGHVDGPTPGALLQHPLGVTVLDAESVAVLDTYNGAVRRVAGTTVTTLARGLREPSGAVLVGADLLVVESAAHRTVRVGTHGAGETIGGTAMPVTRPVTDVSSRTELRIAFELAPGRELDERFGPATTLSVSASPPQLLRSGAGDGIALTRTLELGSCGTISGTLHVSARAASCDDSACYLARQDWGVSVRVTDTGNGVLDLVLRD